MAASAAAIFVTASLTIRNRPPTELPVPLGLTAEPLDPATAGRLGVPRSVRGVVVTSVADNSDAARLGLRVGDIVLDVDGNAADARGGALRPAAAHSITIWRVGATRTVPLP